MPSINKSSDDVADNAAGNAVRRDNLSGEAVAGATSGVNASTPRTFEERATYRRGVAVKNLKA